MAEGTATERAEYWSQRYWETVAEHDKELLAHRNHLSNKYKPVFDAILLEFTKAKNEQILEGTPPPEN